AGVLVLSSDLVVSVERLREEFADIAAGRFDIVIGTQLVAKGHHFPMLNLVGVADADLGLSNGDPRAAEATPQLFHQFIGRAGRRAGVGPGGDPPVGRLASIGGPGSDNHQAETLSCGLARAVRPYDEVASLGPAEV